MTKESEEKGAEWDPEAVASAAARSLGPGPGIEPRLPELAEGRKKRSKESGQKPGMLAGTQSTAISWDPPPAAGGRAPGAKGQ